MEITEDYEVARSQRLREFNLVAKTLLSRDERQILYTVLKDYKRRHDVRRLVQGLQLVFQNNRKIELLKYIRYFLTDNHVTEFDRLTNFHMRFRLRRKRRRKRPKLLDDRLSVSNASTSSHTHKDVRVFTIHRESAEPSLGFSVRGGSEHGLGLYISEIDEGTAAEKSGLEVGDKLLEVNNISVKGAASSTAVKVLTGSNKLKLVVQRTHKVPEWRLSKEKTSWYDVHDRKLISGDFEECGMTHFIRGLDVDVPERRVNLKFGKNDKTLGFNVRGGKEYGLGIYVSKVDKGGLAEKNGVRVGDQVIDVNGVPFDNITHVHAVEVLKDKKHLILTLRDVGRFPAYKELYAEYTWSNGPIRAATSMTGLADVQVTTDLHRIQRANSSADLFANKAHSALQQEIFLPDGRADQFKKENYDGSDDNESLLDFESLANEIYDGGTNNPGYVSDDDDDVQQVVVVHSEETETKTELVEENERKRSGSSSPDLKEYDHADKFHKDHNDGARDGATSPEQLYAKIDKKKRLKTSGKSVDLKNTEPDVDYSDSSSSSSSSVKEGLYNVSVDRDTKLFAVANKSSLHAEKEYSSEVHKDNEVNVGASTSKTDSPTREQNIHYRRHTVHDIRKSSEDSTKDNEKLEPVQKEIQGALYSRIRKLSASSLSASSLSLMNSQENLTKTRSRENIHNDMTLQIRKADNVETVTNSKEINQRSEDTIDNPYDMFADSDSEKLSDGEGETFVNKDENFSMQKIDETLTDLGKRQTTLGAQELNTLEKYGDIRNGENHKNTKWKTFKNMIKGSLRLKSSKRNSLPWDAHASSSPRRKSVFERLHRSSIDGYNMAILEDSARRLLTDEEFEAVMRHVKSYHDGGELESMTDKLLAILDRPEKLLLLRDIRGVIYPFDMEKFDNMVNRYEVEAYEKLSMKLHLPLDHSRSRKPRRRLITTELGERGHFHLRPYGNQGKDDASKPGDKAKTLPYRHESRGVAVARSGSNQSEYSVDSNRVDGAFLTGEENEAFKGAVIVHLSKNKNDLGMELSDKNKPDGSTDLLIAAIRGGSAADDDSVLQVGMILLSVDRHSMSGCTVQEAEAILQARYADKRHVSMKLTLLMPEDWTTM